MRRETVLFDDTVTAGATNVRLFRSLRFPGVVSKLTIVFYPGQQKTLRVNPYLETADGVPIPLTKYAGSRPYFSGDDSKFEIDMNIPFRSDDRIVVQVDNVGSYDYDLYVLFELANEVGF